MDGVNHHGAELVGRLLDVVEHDILPKTRDGVAAGNKVFGAAILRKADLSVVVAETNREIENPLWHGEMHALKRLYELDRAALPEPKECLFLATHEPCSLCLSAITWAGYDNFVHLFSYEDTRDHFAIPHDIRILQEVFATGERREGAPFYNRRNAFWQAYRLPEMIDALDEPERSRHRSRVEHLREAYRALSGSYQGSKGASRIPLP